MKLTYPEDESIDFEKFSCNETCLPLDRRAPFGMWQCKLGDKELPEYPSYQRNTECSLKCDGKDQASVVIKCQVNKWIKVRISILFKIGKELNFQFLAAKKQL